MKIKAFAQTPRWIDFIIDKGESLMFYVFLLGIPVEIALRTAAVYHNNVPGGPSVFGFLGTFLLIGLLATLEMARIALRKLRLLSTSTRLYIVGQPSDARQVMEHMRMRWSEELTTQS